MTANPRLPSPRTAARAPAVRSAVLCATVTGAVLSLTGCGAGHTAHTASASSAVDGLNTQNADGSVLIRDLTVAYNGPEGYQDGSDAPLHLLLFNQTAEPISITITSRPPEGVDPPPGAVSARAVTVTGDPPGTPSPGGPARLDIAPLSFAAYRPGDARTLRAVDLAGDLVPGRMLNLTFTFSHGVAPLTVRAPIAIPESPAPRASLEDAYRHSG